MPPVTGLRLHNLPAGAVSFEFQPSVALIARDVYKFGLDIRSFRVPMKRSIREVVIPSIDTNFRVGGRPKWVPLDHATVKKRTMEGNIQKGILVRSGKLRKVSTQQNIWTVTPVYATIKQLPSKVWYGALHQAGFQTPTRHAPQRQFIMLQPEDVEKIVGVFSLWLEERLQGIVLRR